MRWLGDVDPTNSNTTLMRVKAEKMRVDFPVLRKTQSSPPQPTKESRMGAVNRWRSENKVSSSSHDQTAALTTRQSLVRAAADEALTRQRISQKVTGCFASQQGKMCDPLPGGTVRVRLDVHPVLWTKRTGGSSAQGRLPRVAAQPPFLRAGCFSPGGLVRELPSEFSFCQQLFMCCRQKPQSYVTLQHPLFDHHVFTGFRGHICLFVNDTRGANQSS